MDIITSCVIEAYQRISGPKSYRVRQISCGRCQWWNADNIGEQPVPWPHHCFIWFDPSVVPGKGDSTKSGGGDWNVIIKEFQRHASEWGRIQGWVRDRNIFFLLYGWYIAGSHVIWDPIWHQCDVLRHELMLPLHLSVFLQHLLNPIVNNFLLHPLSEWCCSGILDQQRWPS